MKNDYVKVRMETPEKEELVEIAGVLRVPFSQIAREAIEEKVKDLKENNPKVIAHFRAAALSK